MAVTQNTPGPYAPATAVLDLMRRHRDRGLPAPVNNEVLARAGVSESLIPRTLQALATLDLIDETGAPTAAFETLRRAPEAEYQARMAEWLKSAYADVFAFVDPSKDDPTRIRDAFRGYNPTGQQDRMVTLFQGLCVAAGLMPEKPTAPRPRAGGTASRPSAYKPPAKSTAKASQAGKASTDLPPALTGLLQSLPVNGSGWTKDQRDKFMTTFGAVIDFVIPIKSTSEDNERDSDPLD